MVPNFLRKPERKKNPVEVAVISQAASLTKKMLNNCYAAFLDKNFIKSQLEVGGCVSFHDLYLQIWWKEKK